MVDVVALGELLIDFTENGISEHGNPLLEANPGGAPCNVLAMLQNYGKSTAFIGKVGDDNFGHMLSDTVAGLGINVSGLKYDKDIHTTLAFVHTYEDGDRDFSFYRNPGADVMLSADEVDTDLIKSAKIFHFGTLSMTHKTVEEATIKALDTAKESGILVSFDPNLRPPLWSDLEIAKEKMDFGFRKCDILKISDNEIEFFTGETDILKGAQIIKEKYGIKLVCATLGKDGSYALYGDTVVECAPFLNPNTIETTGAGDTFMGSVINSVLEVGIDNYDEASLKEMLTTANAAASLITTRRGALRVMPSVEEIHNYIKDAK
ncbi:carbohydrate kinase family protein [Pseudobutyrivibrio xylanivorans]|uniref:Fructokinase n=1 Tax=Pseudobutyrivibrio xylanivorans TaxID=185007 RepID=A0A1G5S2I7_PSEXY|nr:carbohydrate kinase [Pseudobutyrivibrio xylanivorans]SCZ80516.1 fructokinase [Pseudobutyrivibrio xylanivorans]